MSTTTLVLIFLFTIVIVYFAAKEGARHRKKSEAKWKNAASNAGNEPGGEQVSTAIAGETSNEDGIPGEVLAAIFMALHEEQEVVHDYENTVLTMDRVVRNYSPWNSKFYGLREVPRR
jgi:hypothetical protein